MLSRYNNLKLDGLKHNYKQRASMRILLIEDNPPDARIVQELLQEDFSKVKLDKAESISMVKEKFASTSYDIILSDLNLPDSENLNTLDAVLSIFPDCPVVVLTGNDDIRLGTEAVKKGAQDYIPKNEIGGSMLYRVINQAIERKRILIELDDARIKAEQANKSKDEFLANMSHELRTPLNSVLGFTQILQDEITNEEHLSMLQLIANAGEILLRHINDMLEIARIQSGKITLIREKYDLEKEIEFLIKSLEQTAYEKSLELLLELDIKNNMIYGDKLRLMQILTNLVTNAIKYTEKGSVLLKVEQGKQSGKKVLFHFDIKDSGIGIAPEDQEKIFEKFAQLGDYLTSNNKGVGLGLSIVNYLVNLMGGEIRLKSKPGVGSVFSVDVPLEIITEEEIPDPKNKMKILLVEDHPANRALLGSILAGAGFNYDGAASGERALHLFELKRYECVLLDLRLNDISGFEVADKMGKIMEAKGFKTRVIAITAFPDVTLNEKIKNHKVIERVLYKPLKSVELIKILTQKYM